VVVPAIPAARSSRTIARWSGNINPLLLSKLLRHGLSAAGRFLGFGCRLPDYPGALAGLLRDLAELGADGYILHFS
jgi:hypothetical protein